jgi:hypothetical protein
MHRTARVLTLAAILSTITATVSAGTVRVALPQLLGEYTIDNLDNGSFSRQFQVMPGVSHFGSERATIELKGSITYGRVRGDGVLRQSSETILDGGFGAWFRPSRDAISLDLGLSLLPEGEFQREWSFSVLFQPGLDDFPIIGQTRVFRPTVAISFGPSWGRLSDEVPFLMPVAQGETRDADDGLIVVEPVIGTITEAYLVIEHRFVPEPSGLALAGAGMFTGVVALLWRRYRQSAGVRR